MFFGDSVEKSNMEILFDVFEESIKTLYDIKPRKYFELFFETADNILSGSLSKTYDEETDEKLLHIYSHLTDVDFAPEDIRKALQSIIIRGYKEEGIHQDVTPDTLGFLIAYLISRLNKEDSISILDPLAGSGNMLLSIENHLNLNCNLYAIENNELKVQILKCFADLSNTLVEIYFQDTTNIKMKDMDFVVFDMETTFDNKSYFPYDVVSHHMNSLKDDGYMIALLPNDFFEHDKDGEFKKSLSEVGRVFGIIELPGDFFKSNPKSIIIFKKNTLVDKNCLMVQLPSFNDDKAFNDVLFKIEEWFLNNKN